MYVISCNFIAFIKKERTFFSFALSAVMMGGLCWAVYRYIMRLALQYIGVYYLTKEGIIYYYPWNRYEQYILWEDIERINICYLEWHGLPRERTSVFRICKKGSGFEQQYPRTRTSAECSRDIKHVFVISCTPERLEEMKHFYPKVNDHRSEEKDPWISQRSAHRKKLD